MGRILIDEIAGFLVDGQIVCQECITEDEIANIKEDELIIRQAVEADEEKELIFCDRCKGRL